MPNYDNVAAVFFNLLETVSDQCNSGIAEKPVAWDQPAILS